MILVKILDFRSRTTIVVQVHCYLSKTDEKYKFCVAVPFLVVEKNDYCQEQNRFIRRFLEERYRVSVPHA